MLPEIERVRGEQLRGTPKTQRLAWSGIQSPDNRIQLVLGEATQVASLGQVLPQQAVGVLVDAVLPVTVRHRQRRPSPRWLQSAVDAPPFPGPDRRSATDAIAPRSD